MTKKGYQKRLPALLPPAPRGAPSQGSQTSGRDAVRPSTSRPPAVPAPRQAQRQAQRETDSPTPAAPGALPPAPGSAATGRVRVLMSAVVVLALVGAVVAVWRTIGGEPDDRSNAAATPGGWPQAGASRTVTQVRPGGELEVTHWLHTTKPLDELEVALPDVVSGEAIRASSLEVVADGKRASGPAVLNFSRATYVFPHATRIRVSYELSGAVELSTSAPGRGLVTTTALAVSPAQPRDTRLVRSEAVLALACASSSATSPVPCGEPETDDQWRVLLEGPGVGSRVVASVTVPS